MKFLQALFSNNGTARGALYVTMASMTPLVAAFKAWENTPPKNRYEVGYILLSCVASGLVALRAYLDQHLSKNANIVSGK